MKITRIDAFQVAWSPDDKPAQRSAFVRVFTDDGIDGIGEASPMQGGPRRRLESSSTILRLRWSARTRWTTRYCSTRCCTRCVKLGPEGALTGALAALDIAIWDIKGKLTGLPIYKLIGGAWRTALPFYASIGGNGDRSLDDVLRVVETRLKDKPAAIKIRFDNPRPNWTAISRRHREGARGAQAGGRRSSARIRCQQRLHHGGAIRVGRALEELDSGGSKSRCSTITSRRWARSRAHWTSRCRPVNRPTRSRRWPI